MVAARDKHTVDWPSIRCAYVESADRVTYAELSELFRVPLNTICSAAADEGWVLQRSQYLEKIALQVGAKEAMIDFAKGNRDIGHAFINFALVGVRRLTKVIESIPEEETPRNESDVIQNCSFAAANFAKSLKEMGITVFPRDLAANVDAHGKDFLRSALQQINVSVSVAQGKAEPAKVTPEPTRLSAEVPE